jgi:acid stress-induced BolA-like protein IbaG/YrbA
MGKDRRSGPRDHRAHAAWDDGSDVLRTDESAPRAADAISDRKNAQLAKIAGRLIESELGRRAQAIDSGMHVAHVEVIGRGTHLRVLVTARDAAGVSSWLLEQQSTLRSALAQALRRKRVPSLSLEFLEGPDQGRVVESEPEGGPDGIE